MQLTVVIGDTAYDLKVPESLLQGAIELFSQMDTDMDRGWQMSRTWVERPDVQQRCQIAADKLLTAMETDNQRLAMMMAGYILHKLPQASEIDINTDGDMTETVITLSEGAPARPPEPTRADPDRPPIRSHLEAIEQAGREISPVYKKGRLWYFSVYHPEQGHWQDTAAVKTEAEANELRMQAYQTRLQELIATIAH